MLFDTTQSTRPSDTQTSLFIGATPLSGEIRSGSGFDRWFESQGPRDATGGSLRELDLHTRIFRHPLSYLVYSESFDGLPACARDYVYGRFAQILTGRDDSPSYNLSAEERGTLRDILLATKPGFAMAYKRANE